MTYASQSGAGQSTFLSRSVTLRGILGLGAHGEAGDEDKSKETKGDSEGLEHQADDERDGLQRRVVRQFETGWKSAKGGGD